MTKESAGFPRYIRDHEGHLWELHRDVWWHVQRRHPEAIPYLDEIEATLRNPDEIRRSRKRHDTLLYYRQFERLRIFRRLVSRWYLCVVVDQQDRVVTTAYLTAKIKQGEPLWKKA